MYRVVGEALKAQGISCLLSLAGFADSKNKCVADGDDELMLNVLRCQLTY